MERASMALTELRDGVVNVEQVERFGFEDFELLVARASV